MEYQEFLSKKITIDKPTGLNEVTEINPMLFEFQRDIVRWALRRGRAAIFADCGLGKTPMQLEWANHIPGRVLILAPLAVNRQTVREGEKFGVPVQYVRDQDEVTDDDKIVITNYEMLDHFDPAAFNGVVLDESSILKSYSGKVRTAIIDAFHETPFKLCCTATPAPNDYMELGNHAEFLRVMTRAEMLAMFFVHDGGETQKWRLKGHAQSKFWEWLCSWSVMVRKPSDLGYEDDGFVLPPIKFHEVVVKAGASIDTLFPMPAQTLEERRKARQGSIPERAEAAAGLVNGSQDAWLFWCNLNKESETLTKLLPGAVEVKGSDDRDVKESRMLGFASGDHRCLVTKPRIAGFGMNWQHCSNVVFFGLSDSYEEFYQATRRCWRSGQKSPVDVYIVTSELEGAVVANIKRKEQDAQKMAENMVHHMADLNKANIKQQKRTTVSFEPKVENGERWEMRLGDCVEEVATLPDNSIDYTLFSPPFASLYTYSASERDMGNATNDEQFIEHFSFLIRDLLRVTTSGRLMSFHCMNLPVLKQNAGYVGLRDFRGELIRCCVEHGWIFHSEVVIWKDPVTAMQRTKSLRLLHKQIQKDSAMSGQGIPDYLITMRKPGENQKPIEGRLDHFVGDPQLFKQQKDLSIDIWQKYASPVWMDIRSTRTLQYAHARSNNDERHICPLQLDVIERCLQLWTMPGDLVLSPFAGIGSEGYCAIKYDRRFIGVELKESYWDVACKNLRLAEDENKQERLL